MDDNVLTCVKICRINAIKLINRKYRIYRSIQNVKKTEKYRKNFFKNLSLVYSERYYGFINYSNLCKLQNIMQVHKRYEFLYQCDILLIFITQNRRFQTSVLLILNLYHFGWRHESQITKFYTIPRTVNFHTTYHILTKCTY